MQTAKYDNHCVFEYSVLLLLSSLVLPSVINLLDYTTVQDNTMYKTINGKRFINSIKIELTASTEYNILHKY